MARQRAFEWSPEQQAFRSLQRSFTIEDPALAVPLPIEALVHAAKADDAIARALLKKQNPILQAALATQRAEGKLAGLTEGKLAGLTEGKLAGLTEGKLAGLTEGKLAGLTEGKLAGLTEGKLAGLADGLVAVLRARGVELDSRDESRIRTEKQPETLHRWLAKAATCTSARELLDG